MTRKSTRPRFRIKSREPKRATTPVTETDPLLAAPAERIIAALRAAKLVLGDGATGTIIFHVPDRAAYDAITTPDELSTGCEEHGVHVKGFARDGLRVCLLHTDSSVVRFDRSPFVPAPSPIMSPFEDLTF